jgi:hypothetical protein
MLALFRDHLSPRDPKSSSLLCTTKEYYSTQISAETDPDKLGFEEKRRITLEDVNVERLLDVFTTIDPHSDSVWDACAYFMRHLAWHKNRLAIPKPSPTACSYSHSCST